MPSLGPTELVVIGVVLLIVAAIVVTLTRTQSPSAARGQRLLKRWGIEQPTEQQGEAAAAYLRTRRRRYLPIFVLLWIVVGGLRAATDASGSTDWIVLLLGTIIASLLIGEVSAMLRPARRGQHSAVLLRRGVTDLVPAYGVVAFSTVTATSLFLVVLNLFLPGTQRSRHVVGTGAMWLLLAALATVIAFCCAVVWLSLIRGRLDEDGAVDAALRIRTARVTIGTGLLLMVWITATAQNRINDVANYDGGAEPTGLVGFAYDVGYPAGTFVFVMGVLAWMLLINPIRKQRLVEAHR